MHHHLMHFFLMKTSVIVEMCLFVLVKQINVLSSIFPMKEAKFDSEGVTTAFELTMFDLS